MRDNLFEYDAAGNITHVVEHGMFGTHKTPVADYLKFNKISLEQLVANNKKAVLDIDSAIRQSPLQGDMMTYRGLNELSSSKRLFGVDFTNMSAAEIEQAVMAKGHFVTEGFFSTAATPKAGPVSGASIVYEIKNKAGTPALDLSKLGGIGSEQEVLIAANTPYKFTGVKVESGPSGKKVIIQCEVADGFDPALAGKLFRQQTEATFGKVDSKAKNSPFYHSPYGSGSSGGNSGGYGHGSGYSGHGYYGGPSTPSPSPYGGGLPSDVII